MRRVFVVLLAGVALACQAGAADDESSTAMEDASDEDESTSASTTGTESSSTDTSSSEESTDTGDGSACGDGVPFPGRFCFELEEFDPDETPGAGGYPLFVEEEGGGGRIYVCDAQIAWEVQLDGGKVASWEVFAAAPPGYCDFLPGPRAESETSLFLSYASGRAVAPIDMAATPPALGTFTEILPDSRSVSLLQLDEDPYPDLIVEPDETPGSFDIYLGTPELGLEQTDSMPMEYDLYFVHSIAADGETARSIAAVDSQTDEAVLFDVDLTQGFVERYRYDDPFVAPYLNAARLGDGPRAELISLSAAASVSYLVVHTPVGQSDWEAQPRYMLQGGAIRSYFGDFDGDGDLDMASPDAIMNSVHLVEFDGATPIDNQEDEFPEFFRGTLATVADINYDGVDDVLWWDTNNDQMVIMRSNP